MSIRFHVLADPLPDPMTVPDRKPEADPAGDPEPKPEPNPGPWTWRLSKLRRYREGRRAPA